MPNPIDERFAKRFPDRNCWLRPATGGERRRQFRGKSKAGWHHAMGIIHSGPFFRSMPFFANTKDLADLKDHEAQQICLFVEQALLDGVMPYCTIKRTEIVDHTTIS